MLTGLLALCLLLAAPAPTLGQEGLNKLIEKAEAYYVEGDYGKAAKTNAKLQKKARKKFGEESPYMATGLVKQARYMVGNGLIVGMEDVLKKGLDMSAKVNGGKDPGHARNLLDATEVLTYHGNYLWASKCLEQATEILQLSGQLDEVLAAQLDMQKAEILIGQGYYSQALQLLNKHQDFLKQQAVDRISYVDDKGRPKSRRLDPEEVELRMGAFAACVTNRANALRFQGRFISADSAFLAADAWIDKNMGRRTIAYAKNLFLIAQMLEENGSIDLPEKQYEKALRFAKNGRKPSHLLALDVQEALIRNLMRQEKKGKRKIVQTDFDKVTRKAFDKKSIHNLKYLLIEYEGRLNKERLRNLENQANDILTGYDLVPQYHPARIRLLTFLYRVAIIDEKYQNGEGYLEQILSIKENLYGKEAPQYHLTQLRLAGHYVKYTDKLDEAEAIYAHSWNNVLSNEITFGHVDYMDLLNEQAELYMLRDKYATASELLETALESARAKYDNEDVEYGRELDKIAQLQIKIGQYQKAQANTLEALEILKSKDGYEAYYASALETQARLKAIFGEFDAAEDFLFAADKYQGRASLSLDKNTLTGIDNMANLHLSMGNFGIAERLLDESIVYKRKLLSPTSSRLVEPLTDYSKLLLTKGDYTAAENTIRQAANIALRVYGENSTKTAKVYMMFAELYTTLGDYERAEEYTLKATNIRQKEFGDEHIDLATGLAQLGLLRFYQDAKPESIEPLLLKARGIILGKLGPENPKYAEVLEDLAKLYIADGRFDDAYGLLAAATAIWKSKLGRRNNIKLASIYALLGDIYYFQKDFDLAEDNYQDAMRLYRKFFSREHPEYVKMLSKMAKVYYMQDDPRRAKSSIEEALANYNQYIKVFFPALSEREKTKFWNTIRADYEFFNSLAIQQRDRYPELVAMMYNNALLTKALLLNSSIKMRQRIVNSTDEALKAKFNEWNGKKEQMTKILAMSDEEVQASGLDPVDLAQEIELLEKELSQKSELFAQSFEEKAVSWENVQSALKDNEVAIEMVRFRHFDHVFTDSVIYAVMYVTPQSKKEPSVVVLGNGQKLEGRYLKYYRNCIKYRLEDSYSYQQFWEPIEKAIPASSTLYLSPDGVYNQINLEAIPVNNERYVLDNSNIILVSNTKSLYFRKVKTRLVQQEKQAVIFGNPQFYAANDQGQVAKAAGTRVVQLPGTQKEIEELKALMKAKGWTASEYLMGEASEDSIKQMYNPKVFHIATHGFFKPKEALSKAEETIDINNAKAYENPLLRTGLLLSGAGDILKETAFNYNMESGILTAYEAMNLNLDYTELVVLSACETGLGDIEAGEGVYGLQRAFLVAGAQSLIMSLFKVDDQATKQLMVKFYKKWLETGNKRQAFIDAKKEIRVEYQDPIYWGAFIMIGLD